MQQLHLHKKLYHISKIDETEYSKEAYDRFEKLQLFDELVMNGCHKLMALRAIKTSKATFYRWRKKYNLFGLAGLDPESRCPNKPREALQAKSAKSKIRKIRIENPLYGKEKIAVILRRDHGINISASTVGRVLSCLIANGEVKSAAFFYGRIKAKRGRVFNRHAQRWKYGMKAAKAGELIQIDHMSIELESGSWVKHFDATCPITKISIGRAYSRATSKIAKAFLLYLIELYPGKVLSIQVDGGSEFRDEFESACAELKIELFVLPPRSPKYNGCVERLNSSVKYEFYTMYNGPTSIYLINKRLSLFMEKYNNFRPHQGLQYKTPMSYYQQLVTEKVSYVMN